MFMLNSFQFKHVCYTVHSLEIFGVDFETESYKNLINNWRKEWNVWSASL